MNAKQKIAWGLTEKCLQSILNDPKLRPRPKTLAQKLDQQHHLTQLRWATEVLNKWMGMSQNL
jgi:hypothetical protein